MTDQKFWDLDHDPVAVLVGRAAATDDLRSALASRADLRVESVADGDAAVDRLSEWPTVECLWLTDALADGESALDVVERAVAADPATVVAFAPSDGDEALAGRATAAGASEYVPSDASLDERVDRLETAVARGVDRRHDATKRSVLDTMLEDLDVTMFAKDERARHLLYAERENAPDPRAVYGKTDLEVYDPEHGNIQESYQDDRAVIEHGERVDGKVETVAEVGRGWMWVKKVPWRVDGETRGLVGLSVNITEWKQRERDLLRQVGRLQQLPDYLVHDLRNPLGVARGYLDLAREGDEEAIDVLQESFDRMEELLDDFHSLATQSADAGTDVEPVLLADVVEDLWRYVTTGTSTLELEFDPETRVVADEGQLRPLLKNLLGNAVDHAGPDVTVRVGLLEDGFYVADDGPGVPQEIRSQIFDQGITTDTEGTGLGLAIVEEAAMLHGWEVSVTESSDGGACFEVRDCLIGGPLDARPAGEGPALSSSVDVGDVAVPGSADQDGDAITVTGSGQNIWSYDNEFHFCHAPVDSDVRIQGRVADLEEAAEYSKAGLMIRSGLDEDDAYAFVGLTAGDIPEVLWRAAPGLRGKSAQIGGQAGDVDWFRIDRVENDVLLSVSADGETWLPVDRRTISLGCDVYVGLAVCSTVATEAVEARFEDVDVFDLER